MDYQRIVWFASYPKSGNTWLRLFMDAYLSGKVDINEILSTITDNRLDFHASMTTERLPNTYPIDVQQLTRPMAMLRMVESHDSDLPLFIKTHAPNMLANGIEQIPAQLTKSVIHIHRDPRDVAVSWANHLGVTIDEAIVHMEDRLRCLVATETTMMDLLSSWDAHTLSYLNDDRHNTRSFAYEDMREKPLETFTEIVRHAGLPVDEDRVQMALDAVAISKLRKIEAESGFSEASKNADKPFFGKAKVGGWRDVLSETQKYKIERKFGRVMKRLGYLEAQNVARYPH